MKVPLVPFVAVFLLAVVPSCLGSCGLTRYKRNRFMNSARVHTDFKGLMQKLNNFASSCDVKVYVTSSFRKSGQHIGGAIVKPARRSNHYVGHAIDMNVVDKNGKWCNSRCLRYSLNQHPDVQCFIEKVQKDPDLRWGGDFSTPDVVHIDDGINLRNPSVYDQLYNTLQKDC